MKHVIFPIVAIITLSGCAQTPQEAAAYRQFGMQMLSASQPQPRASTITHTNCQAMGNTLNCTTW